MAMAAQSAGFREVIHLDVEKLIAAAKSGDRAAREQLFERVRNYIGILARTKVEGWMRSKFDGSDLVQQTLLEAYTAFEQFEGATEAEWLAWLRQILSHNTRDVIRHYRTGKRAADQEHSPVVNGDASRVFEPTADLPSPSRLLMRREEDLVLSDAISQLPPDYQEVIQLRSLQRLSFEEVAERMERSRPATQMLWTRAIKQLERLLTDAAE